MAPPAPNPPSDALKNQQHAKTIMDLWWLLLAVPAIAAFAWLRRPRPTVAEVHSWEEDGVYRMLLVLNDTDTIVRAGMPLPDRHSVPEAARAMLAVLARKVRFTPRTVFIPEGPMGLNGYPA